MPEVKRELVSVTERALVQRINRKLMKQDKKLMACRRTHRDWHTLGDWYLLSTELNAVINYHVGVEELAKELGVLKPYEAVASE